MKNLKPFDKFKNTDKIYCFIPEFNDYFEINPFLSYEDQIETSKNKNHRYSVEIYFDDKILSVLPSEFNYPIYFGSKIKQISQSFLRWCGNFNQPIDMSQCKLIKKIDSNFLSNCWKFNSEIKLPPNLKYISEYFLFKCKAFNKEVSIPQTVQIIDNNFMSQCKNFNSSINLNKTKNLKFIGRSFLSKCENFNQDLKIPQSVEIIERNFLMLCKNFDKTLLLPSKLKKLGLDFLAKTNGSINKSIPKSLAEANRNFYDEVTKLHNEGFSHCEIPNKLSEENRLQIEWARIVGLEKSRCELPINNFIKLKMRQITNLHGWPKLKSKALKKKV